MNSQPPSKRIESLSLEVTNIFRTIQGEGPFTGMPATFIRLAGCNLQCPLCDTEYPLNRTMIDADIMSECLSYKLIAGLSPINLVVITGGEPFRQGKGLANLCRRLVTAGFFVQIESNGSLPIPEDMFELIEIDVSLMKGVYIVVSPKTSKINDDYIGNSCAIKFVMKSQDMSIIDGLPLKALGLKTLTKLWRPQDSQTPIYLQPLDEQDTERNAENLQTVISSCKTYGYRLQLQIHKLIGAE